MIHLHIIRSVPPHRVEELLDRIHRAATRHGTFDIVNLIDEYREDVVLVPIDDKKEKANGRTQDRRTEGR